MKTLTKEQYEFLLTIKDCVGGCDDNTDYDDGEIQSAWNLGNSLRRMIMSNTANKKFTSPGDRVQSWYHFYFFWLVRLKNGEVYKLTTDRIPNNNEFWKA